MNTLVAYRCSHHLFETLDETLRIQRTILEPTWEEVIVADQKHPNLQTLIRDDIYGEHGMSLAKASNRAMYAATELDYDALLLLDADIVLQTEPTEQAIPSTGVGVVFCHFQAEDEQIPPAPVHPHYRPTAQWILNREVFSRFRYCEDFEGHGWEDHDFHYNVLWPAGYDQQDSDILAIHRWHPVRYDLSPTGLLNEARFKARARIMARKNGQAPPKLATPRGQLDEEKLEAMR